MFNTYGIVLPVIRRSEKEKKQTKKKKERLITGQDYGSHPIFISHDHNGPPSNIKFLYLEVFNN